MLEGSDWPAKDLSPRTFTRRCALLPLFPQLALTSSQPRVSPDARLMRIDQCKQTVFLSTPISDGGDSRAKTTCQLCQATSPSFDWLAGLERTWPSFQHHSVHEELEKESGQSISSAEPALGPGFRLDPFRCNVAGHVSPLELLAGLLILETSRIVHHLHLFLHLHFQDTL